MGINQDKVKLFWEGEILPQLQERKESGMLAQTAKDIGCHAQTLYKYLDGSRGSKVPFSQLKKVAKGLGFPDSQIVRNCFDQTEKMAIITEKYPELVEKLYDALKNSDNYQYIENLLDLASGQGKKAKS